MALVRFNVDVSPYCKGDVVRLKDDETKRVDEVAKQRDLKDAYTVQETKTTETKTKKKK